MDIWAWVDDLYEDLWDSGHTRLARLLYEIPNDLHDNNFERVDACIPEAIAGARALKNPWMEVFFRHWGLRNRLSNHGEGESALSEAADLMDFAHREDTKNCPQSICVTQDLASCYANMDGPNWVQERLEVCTETLSRIDPERNCFDCISREVANAYRDDKNYSAAEAFLKQQAEVMRKAGNSPCGYYVCIQADTAMRLGKLEEAEQFLEDVKNGPLAEQHLDALMLSYKMDLTYLHILKGNIEEARELLPKWSELSLADHADWLAKVVLLAPHYPDINSWNLGTVIQQSVAQKRKYGAHRDVFEILKMYIDLALLRKSKLVAELAFKQLIEAQNQLRYPEKEQSTIDTIAKKIELLAPEKDAPVPAEKLMEYIFSEQNRNPEETLPWLKNAIDSYPKDIDLAINYCSAMCASGFYAQAKDYIWQLLDRNDLENTNQLIDYLSSIVQTLNSAAEEKKLSTYLEKNNPAQYLIHKIRVAKGNADWSSIEQLVRDAESKGLASVWHYGNLAFAYRNQENFYGALNVTQQVLSLLNQQLDSASAEEAEMLNRQIKNVLWDMLAYATAARDWKQVREIGTSLEVTMPEGKDADAIRDEKFYNSPILIRAVEDAQHRIFFAHRDGPTSAKIVSIHYENDKQKVGDWVVFDPTLVEEYPEDPEEQENFIPTFDLLTTLEKGGYTGWAVYGTYSDNTAIERFLAQIESQGWMFWVYERESSDFFMRIATPNHQSAQAVHVLMKEFTQGVLETLCWPELAQKAGMDVELHQMLAEKYAP